MEIDHFDLPQLEPTEGGFIPNIQYRKSLKSALVDTVCGALFGDDGKQKGHFQYFDEDGNVQDGLPPSHDKAGHAARSLANDPHHSKHWKSQTESVAKGHHNTQEDIYDEISRTGGM